MIEITRDNIMKENIHTELKNSIYDAIDIVCKKYKFKIHYSEINQALSSILLINTNREVKKIKPRKYD